MSNYLKKKLKFKLIFTCIMFFSILINESYSKNYKIVKKINNEIITNIDIETEYLYLSALNKNLKKLGKDEAYKIAEESLIREKIKFNEISKFTNIKLFKDEKLINQIMMNIIEKIDLKTIDEFKLYLKNINLNFSDVREKIIIEILWNQLIFNKYKDKIIINKEKITQTIEKNNLNQKQLYEYDLYEIVFQANDQENFLKLVLEIKESINTIGFQNTASKYSISNTANFGGKIGLLKENQLSKIIKNNLDIINVGNYTEPINVGGNFLILFINDKKMITEQIDKNQLVEKMIEYEKSKQFDNYSQVYFNKIKINTIINDL